MELEDLFPRFQVPATRPSSESDESSPCPLPLPKDSS